MPVSLFSCPFPSYSPGYFSFGLYCYFSHVSTNSYVMLEQKVLPPHKFGGLEFIFFKAICIRSQWKLITVMVIFLLLTESSEKMPCFTAAFHHVGRTVCVPVITAVLIRPFLSSLLKQSSCGPTCRKLDRKYTVPSLKVFALTKSVLSCANTT